MEHPCNKPCGNKTASGYCATTACINPQYSNIGTVYYGQGGRGGRVMYEMDEKCRGCKNNGTAVCNQRDMYYDEFDPIDKPPTTNADRLRAMSDEELAEWLVAILNHAESDYCGKSCPLYSYCIESNGEMLDWLRQEVTNDP